MMTDFIPRDTRSRMEYIIDQSWKIFFQKLVEGRVRVNKESSMQLHYSTVLQTVGTLLCILPGESFSLELESSYGRKNIDIVCTLDDVRAAIELKCFRKKSNRAQDLDMYDVWKDIERLSEFKDFQVKRFICLTDDSRYPNGNHGGYSATFSIAEGAEYSEGDLLTPQWVGRWKDTSRDHPIRILKDTRISWVETEGWYFMSEAIS